MNTDSGGRWIDPITGYPPGMEPNPFLYPEQRERLLDIIGESGSCNDNDCSCHRKANLAQLILDGEENYEVIDGE